MLPDLIAVFAERIEQVPFSMAIGNMELMHKYFPKHLFASELSHKTKEEGEKSEYGMKNAIGRKDAPTA